MEASDISLIISVLIPFIVVLAIVIIMIIEAVKEND